MLSLQIIKSFHSQCRQGRKDEHGKNLNFTFNIGKIKRKEYIINYINYFFVYALFFLFFIFLVGAVEMRILL